MQNIGLNLIGKCPNFRQCVRTYGTPPHGSGMHISRVCQRYIYLIHPYYLHSWKNVNKKHPNLQCLQCLRCNCNLGKTFKLFLSSPQAQELFAKVYFCLTSLLCIWFVIFPETGQNNLFNVGRNCRVVNKNKVTKLMAFSW